MRSACCLLFVGLSSAAYAQSDVVFRSDVSLIRVDAQVVDQNNRAITGLGPDDFILLEEGHPQQIRNFASEDMPVDVVLLLDVSGSMEPHVERIASAAHQALRVLAGNDRVAVMVFDRSTRLRLPFRTNRDEIERELENVIRTETFDGGTDITRGMRDAAAYIEKEGRPEARRAIVILTDDQTERGRDEDGVIRALARADAVLSALLAPDAMRTGVPGIGWPGGGGGGGPLGGIIFGRRGPYGRRRPPVISMPHTQSAGTAEIARRSGGDSMRVDDALALETTLARIRQRYALHFYLPPGVQPGQERNIEVQLSGAARRRYQGAEVKFRRVYLAPGGPADPYPTVVAEEPGLKHRPPEDHPAGWPRVGDASTTSQPSEPARQAPAATAAPADSGDNSAHGGWRRVKPGEQP